MKKSAAIGHSQDHVKPFIVAIGIAFTFLALVVIYVAFTKGGLDIRSRASDCPAATYNIKTKKYTCSSGVLQGKKCCPAKTNLQKAPAGMTKKLTPTPTFSMKMTSTTTTPVPGRCCPKVNTTYAKNTCNGASKTACTNNLRYCMWTTVAYCSF
ncbi:MAG: hypothetical protein WAV51_00885 [Microgenomates group bacterium]